MKKVFICLLTMLFGLGLFSTCSSCKHDLYLFSWGNYFNPDLISKFEEKYNCCVIQDIFDSNESMYAKLKLGSLEYDIITPSSYFIEVLREQGILQPLNFNAIPNAKYVDMDYSSFFSKINQEHCIPYTLSYSGIGYRADKIPELDPSWNVFGLTKYKGRMTMLNDIREALGAALKFLGYSLNTIQENEINAAADELIKWKRNLAKFESELFKSGIASSEYLIVQGYSSDLFQVIREVPQVKFAFPKEGTSLSIDCLAIPKNAKNSEMALNFINFFLEPEIAAENMTYILTRVLNKGAYEKLDPEFRSSPILFPSKENLDKSEVIKDLGSATQLYYRAWDRVKSTK